MDNLDGIEGIGGDRKFVDLLYSYYNFKDSLSDFGDNPNVERQSSVYYLSTVNYCLARIQQLPDGSVKRNYLDWLRWNMDVILVELEQYQVIPHLSTLVTAINSCKDNIRAIAESHLQLSEAEKGISNQYVHAYQRFSLPINHPRKTYIFAGKLLINYVNLLKKRFYIHNLDRDGITFIQLDAEADYLATQLSSLDGRLASDIKTTVEKYAEFRLMDDAIRRAGDKNIELALKLAHIRATESFLEAAIRKIRETIRLITLKLEERLSEVWDVVTVFSRPILHPKEAARNLHHFFKNFKESVKELCNWACENPWKSCTLVLGGILIGAVVGAAPIALFDLALDSIAIPTISYMFGSIGGVTLPLAIASSKAVQLKAEAKQEIAVEEAKKAKLIAENNKKGLQIAKEAIFEEHRREFIWEAKKLAEEIIRGKREEEKRAEEEREREINSMNPKELEAKQEQLLKSNEEVAVELKVIQTEIAQNRNKFRQTQIDIFKVREGMAAVSRIMQDIGDKTGEMGN